MTKNDLKQKLNLVYKLDTELKILNIKIERWEAMTQGHAIRYDVDKVQTSPGDPVAAAMEPLYKLLDKRKKIQIALARAVEDTNQIIDAVPDDKGRLIMHYRYTACLSWEEIARRMSYTERHVMRFHDDAFDWICSNL